MLPSSQSWCLLRWLRVPSAQLWRHLASEARPGPVPLLHWKPRSSRRRTARPFVDWRRVRVRAGSGGHGAVSLARVFANPRAGPDGGDGGAGGHVVFEANTNMRSLNDLNSVIIAPDGEKGSKRECHGKTAEHLVLQVPVGTMFQTQDGALSASLDVHGAQFVAARGGAGGRGNKYFATDTNQTPRFAELGAPGEEFSYSVELRTMADVGLIGFPNAGKSTLLRAVSRARPKVAAYPFTTLRPHVGMVQYSDYQQLAVADIPGLVPDAHKNRGLGVQFLRHVQRCSCLVYVLDASDAPAQQLEVLKHELDCYLPGLAGRPHAVVANKCDIPGTEENLRELEEAVHMEVIPISAKMGDNIPRLLCFLRTMCDEYKQRTQDEEEDFQL